MENFERASERIEALELVSEPVSEVARKVLLARLKRVWKFATLAAKHSEEDIEYIHRLRVSARKAEAALEVFEDLLRPKELRWIRKNVGRLRRTAGAARDLDVLVTRLAEVPTDNKKLSGVVSRIRSLRRAAQKSLVRHYQAAKRKRFRRRSRRMVRRMRWRGESPEPAFVDVAQVALVGAADAFFAAARDDLSNVSALHQMRIRGKRLRYRMELFSGTFEGLSEEALRSVREVQGKLGIVNDHATAIHLITGWLEDSGLKAKHSENIRRIVCEEERQQESSAEQFRDWWTDARAANLKQQLALALGLGANVEGSAKLV